MGGEGRREGGLVANEEERVGGSIAAMELKLLLRRLLCDWRV